MRILFACGGTGGHIYPAIAIADEIRKLVSDVEILFIGAKGKIEEKIVPECGYELKTVEIKGLDRKSIIKNIGLPFKLMRAVRECKKIIRDFSPDAAVGTGGYASVPAIYAASKLGIPALIQGGDAFPGRATKFLARYVKKIVINFEETAAHLKFKLKLIHIAHPVRSSLNTTSRDEAYKFFDLDENQKTLFVFGGSQGAKGINDTIAAHFDKLMEMNVNLIWQVGKNDFEDLHDRFGTVSHNVKVYEFIQNMGYAYSIADLVVCRAGISSIMELSSIGVPALLVPYPYAAENHQEKNARALEREGAAKVIVQSELEEKFFDTIKSILDDHELLSNMRMNIKQFGDPEAAGKIANEVLKLAS